MRRAQGFAIAACLFVSQSGCRRQAPIGTDIPKQQVLETMVVKRQSVGAQIDLPAHLMANPTKIVHIYPMISGRVVALRILPGQEVRKGQNIGSLESTEATQARSDYEKAKVEAARADRQLARARELLAHEVMAQKDYDDLKALDDADHADLARTRQTLHLLGFNEDDVTDLVPIVSPISGVVLDVGTGTGELQRSLDNATSIATIADIDSIWVVGDLYPRDQANVHLGQPATVTVNGYPGWQLHEKVENISDAVDPVTLTLKVRVAIPNPEHRLKPGAYANLSLTGQLHDAIVVPASAVIRNGNDVFVFVQTAPGKYEHRNVTLGETHADSDQILQGLNDGDKVVTGGAELLRSSGSE
ncbi:efflux RND transporter periplasmic adaptor subunit [Acidobacteria bacterium AB60]|nr:efflux RND transporter periplasmic adaptor subunit [Acidobacteria bacterium AB60]